MTPKEKASELYNKFRNEIPVMSANVRGKRIALIAVDAIIKELVSVSFNYDLDFSDNILRYWKDVKSEIEKL